MRDLLESLNPKQKEAVELPSEHALILAGAGSGKTRVLTTRIAWLIAQGKAKPWEILAVTFTNKAAREMKTRLEAMLSMDVSTMCVGTFHGIAHRLLRLHATEANLPKSFQIIDQADQLSLIRRLMAEVGLRADDIEPKEIQNRINFFKESGLRSARVDAGINFAQKKAAGLYQKYEARCQKDGLVDFAELLLRSLELLEGNVLLREHYAKRFKYVLVDEFQDTNALQFRWIRAIASPQSKENTLFCVGDDDQSIYAFRGARVGNIADFVHDYQVKHIVKLEQNYRSTSHILDAANAVIANNADRMGKNLWTDAGAGDLITVYMAQSDIDEARMVAQTLMTEVGRVGKYSDVAILYRNNAQSRVLEQCFNNNLVPYRIYGGLRFFDRQEVKDVMAYLRVMTQADDTSLLRVINHPPRGIGATTIERIQDWAQDHSMGLWEAMGDARATEAEPAFARTQVFVDLIASMRFETKDKPLNEVVAKVIKLSGLKDYYDKQRDRDIRIENMNEIVNAAAGYCEENGIDRDFPATEILEGGNMSPMEGFLAQAVLESDDKNEQKLPEAVQLMTIHASKGLEFPIVFICGLEEGLFPHTSRFKLNAEKEESEERRLMYVAMTRAKKKLFISCCQNRMLYGARQSNSPSRFLEEIPKEHIKETRSQYLEEEEENSDSSYYGSSYARGGYSRRTQTRSTPMVYKASDLVDKPFMRTATLAQDQDNEWGLHIGDAVEHPKFGRGIVQKITVIPGNSTATVRFKMGVKELLLRIAKLKKIES